MLFELHLDFKLPGPALIAKLVYQVPLWVERTEEVV